MLGGRKGCDCRIFWVAVSSGIFEPSAAMSSGSASRAVQASCEAAQRLLFLVLAWGLWAAASSSASYNGKSLLSMTMIVLNTTISAHVQSFDSEATETSRCSSTLQGNSVLQLITAFGDAPSESSSNISLGIIKIVLYSWSSGADYVTDRYEVEGNSPRCSRAC